LILKRLHNVISQKMALFITTDVKTSKPTELHYAAPDVLTAGKIGCG
jgi:hypothetical protein